MDEVWAVQVGKGCTQFGRTRPHRVVAVGEEAGDVTAHWTTGNYAPRLPLMCQHVDAVIACAYP